MFINYNNQLPYNVHDFQNHFYNHEVLKNLFNLNNINKLLIPYQNIIFQKFF